MPWLLAVVFLVSYEIWAFMTERTTLSRMVWRASQSWPLLPWVIGAVCGGMAVHFWWPWCPGLGVGHG